jgi:transposase
MNERSWVRLSKQERQELRRLLQSGLQPVRTVLRALALRQLADGQPIRQVAKNVALTPKTVWLTSQRYRQGGLERALYERPRPGKAALLEAQHRQRIVALACGPPPEGRSRWTVRLLTEEVVKRKLVPQVGRETIRVLLESHDLKPWREKNVVRSGTGRRIYPAHGGHLGGVRKAAE